MNAQATLKNEKNPSRLKAHPSEVALVSVIRAGARLLKSSESLYTSIGLTGAQYNVLRILEGAGEPIPQQEIADKLLVSRANVTGLLDKLEAKELIERLPCEDRRVNMVRLMGKGFGLIEKSFGKVTENSIRAMSNLTKDEQKTLVRLLEKLEV